MLFKIQMETNLLSLPEEMLAHLASFLNNSSLKMFSSSSFTINQSIRPIIGQRFDFKANRDFMCYGMIPLRIRTDIRHAHISSDWVRFGGTPLRTFVETMKNRMHSGTALQSVHLERFIIRSADLAALLEFAPNLRLMVFGKEKHPMHSLKTLAMQTNSNLRAVATQFIGFERIVVRTFGNASSEFRESLANIIRNNISTLIEVDIDCMFEDYLPFELTGDITLRSLKTKAPISSFITDMNVSRLSHLECSIQHSEPMLKSAFNLKSLKINLGVDEWDIHHIRKMLNFFPNLLHLEVKSSYMQTPIPEDHKIKLEKINSMKARYLGVTVLSKLIVPNLLSIETSPISRTLNSHLATYSPKLETIRGKDNLILKIETIKDILISHNHIKFVILNHDSLTCACDLLKFVIKLRPFIFMRARCVNVELFFDTDVENKESMMLIFKAIKGVKVEDYGENARIDIGVNARILVRFLQLSHRRTIQLI